MSRLGCLTLLLYTVFGVGTKIYYNVNSPPPECERSWSVYYSLDRMVDPPPPVEINNLVTKNNEIAAFEKAQRNYYEKWCTSDTWDTDPPSAAAAVDWAHTVLVFVD